MPTYIGDEEPSLAKNNAQDWFGRTPYVGSIVPKDIFAIGSGQRKEPQSGPSPHAIMAARGSLGHKPPESRIIETKITQTIYFQYFPETISDERGLNVAEMRPFFLSNAIPTVSGSSPRDLSFTIRFTRERWLYGQELSEADWDKYNVDVALAIQAIRSMTYPIAQLSMFGIIPQPVKLTLPGTGIGINSDTVTGLITSYSVEYLSFFADGQPRIANVALKFSEYPIYDIENITRNRFANVLNEFSQRMYKVIQPAETLGIGIGITRRTDVESAWTVRER